MKTAFKKLLKTDKQKEVIKKVSKCRNFLAYGGSRSGKTIILLFIILLRASRVKSQHLIARSCFAHAKQSFCLGDGTFPQLFKILGINGRSWLNKSDWYYELPNGSTIWIGGLDEKDRVDKILGKEFATIWLNEVSEISYETYETVKTRLNPGDTGLRGLFLMDENPGHESHWTCQIFLKRVFPKTKDSPGGRPVPENDYFHIQINPEDNPNLPDEYHITLSELSYAKQIRFMKGEFSDISGDLWSRSWIQYRSEYSELWRVVIGVDPSGSVNGDEIGIVTAGKWNDYGIVLEDASMHGTPAQWSATVASQYQKWEADVIVAEKNYGGDMVEHTIKSANPGLNVRLINSSRGKVVRAEPVSAMYEKGKIFHRRPFVDLEDEMCTYRPGNESPNRMDALVFALTELMGTDISILDVI